MITKLKVGDVDITKPPQKVELIPESIKYIKKEGKMTATKKTSAKKTEKKTKPKMPEMTISCKPISFWHRLQAAWQAMIRPGVEVEVRMIKKGGNRAKTK